MITSGSAGIFIGSANSFFVGRGLKRLVDSMEFLVSFMQPVSNAKKYALMNK